VVDAPGWFVRGFREHGFLQLYRRYRRSKMACWSGRSQNLYDQPEDFVFASERLKGRKPLDLAAVLKKKIQPAFQKIGIAAVGWHT
jgi:hypothetical protein